MNAIDTGLGPMSTTPILRVASPGDLVEVVPYMLGVRPTDSLVVLGLSGGPGTARRTSGPALRCDLPSAGRFALVARETTALAVRGGAGALAVLFHADTPAGADGVGRGGADLPGRAPWAAPARRPGESAPAAGPGPVGPAGPVAGGGECRPPALRALRPLHEAFVLECRRQGVPLVESLCVTAGRWWSYVCRNPRCCPREGTPLRDGRSSAVAAAAVCAGLPEPAPLTDLVASFAPPADHDAEAVERALDRVAADLTARAAGHGGEAGVRSETFALLQAARDRFRRGDRDLTYDEAARLITGLTDVEMRDRAMSWETDDDDGALLALWTALSRIASGADRAAPLTLAAWVAWTTGRPEVARVAVRLALEADPDYTMADLLRIAVNSPLCPDSSRRALFPDGDVRSPGGVRPSAIGPRPAAPGRSARTDRRAA